MRKELLSSLITGFGASLLLSSLRVHASVCLSVATITHQKIEIGAQNFWSSFRIFWYVPMFQWNSVCILCWLVISQTWQVTYKNLVTVLQTADQLFSTVQFQLQFQCILHSLDPYGLWPIGYRTCQYWVKVINIIHDLKYNTIIFRIRLNRWHSDYNVIAENGAY